MTNLHVMANDNPSLCQLGLHRFAVERGRERTSLYVHVRAALCYHTLKNKGHTVAFFLHLRKSKLTPECTGRQCLGR
jgi:hypothetical protein